MPSPFPGMDPYLEGPSHWGGLHMTLIVALRGVLTPRLPRGYFAEIHQYVWLESEDDPDRRWVGPDVYVGEGGGRRPRASAAEVTAPSAAVTIPTLKKPGKRYIGVTDKDDNRVVTVIELLSPSDKGKGTRKDRANYLAKREEYFGAGVNLVEIDLLRTGSRPPTGDPDPPGGDYLVLVSRADDFPEAAVWSFTVRQPLPVIPVPLKPEDDDVPLPLRPALDRAYADAGYADRIDYSKPPVPDLRPEDAEWAADLLKKHAKKRKK
ncbi:MAG: DUF4058 family protein [Gemmataceae bacterium]|nr:DUF4058 family protein [Gemmataceae bacterium]